MNMRPVRCSLLSEDCLFRGSASAEPSGSIKTVVRLRTTRPVDRPGVLSIHCAVSSPDGSIASYYEMSPKLLADFICACSTIMSIRQPGVLVHCKHGLDRTGIVVAAILRRLGADWDSVMEDHCRDFRVDPYRIELMKSAQFWIDRCLVSWCPEPPKWMVRS
jgi:hypothetical protein